MKRPRLIQRCTLKDGKLRFDDMGISDFQWGTQNSLRRIFEKGIVQFQTGIRFNTGSVVPIELVGSRGFDLVSYQGHIERIATDSTMRFAAAPRFKDEIEFKLGLKRPTAYQPRVNVWFDIENDVLWTIEAVGLSASLNLIRERWQARPTAGIS
ncbi:MAG: hypothetical protein KBC81_01170 [Candidatus Pacebacteria bacterium]|nr:hypothetical protein [Candidatus Paceibacterota bacterium]